MRSVIIDGPDSWSQNLVKEGMVEQFMGIDFADADTIFDRCLAAINKIKQVREVTQLGMLPDLLWPLGPFNCLLTMT